MCAPSHCRLIPCPLATSARMLAAQLAHDDFRVIGRCGKMAKDDIADVRSRVIMADQASLALQLRPVDGPLLGERRVFRQYYDQLRGPERQAGDKFRPAGLANHDREVGCA